VAVGLNVVIGLAGLLDLGYVGFYALGAYSIALFGSTNSPVVEALQSRFGLSEEWAVPFAVCIPIAILMSLIAGVFLGAPTLRLRGDYLAIVTLGFGEIIRIFLNNLSEPFNLTNGPKGITTIDSVKFLGMDFANTTRIGEFMLSGTVKYYFLLLLLLVLVVVVNLRLQNSRIGRAWEAIREDELAARAMGINTRNMKLLAFAMGASFGGIAGGMFSAIQGFISPESFVLNESVMVLAMVVLGGMGNIWGVILGAILLSFVPEILRYTVEPMQRAVFGRSIIDPEVIRMLLFGLAMVVMMLFRPAGLWPSAVRKRELAAVKPPQ
jgi:branched-chain amino acid transport system permease protein